MADPLAFEPLDDSADPWVQALERTEMKVKNPDLSFYKYCMATFNRAPTVFAHTEPDSPTQAVFEPPVDLCPAVVIETSNAMPGEDHGAGGERWYFNLMLYAKFVVKDGDQRKCIRAFHELIRTVMRGWRTGTLDPLSTISNGGYVMLQGDLTPEFSRARSGLLFGKAAMGLRFVFSENILG